MSLVNSIRAFSTTVARCQVQILTRLKVVDNSRIGRAAELAGKPAKVIGVCRRQGIGYLGDKVYVAIQGETKYGYLVGLKQKQKRMVPRYDSNNVVLVELDGTTPTGTRIRVPIPSCLRGKGPHFTKILACATKFI